ncbi:MAG TPA: TSUP family transporter, partial [Chloroflexota bacterium]|nr:TSUP family transporter [Chloroflexota bacterium]
IIPTTFTGGIGKILTGQFDLSIAAVVIVGSIVGAQFGGRVNARVSSRTIKRSLIVLLLGILLRTGYDLLIA